MNKIESYERKQTKLSKRIHQKFDEEWDTNTVLGGKRVRSQRQCMADTTLIKESKGISLVVRQIETMSHLTEYNEKKAASLLLQSCYQSRIA